VPALPVIQVLLVDDRHEQRVTLSAALAPLDVGVVQAASGRDSLRCLLRHDFAVVLLDVNMPDMDGFETAALIRGRERSESTPIIFITADADDARAARAYSLGAVDYILTPVDPDVLRSKVSVFVELFRRTEEGKRQAAALRRHAEQLRCLANSAFAIHAAKSIGELVKVMAETGRALVEAREVGVEVALSESAAGKPGRRVEYRYRCGGEGAEDRDCTSDGPGQGAREIQSDRSERAGAAALLQGSKGEEGWLVARLLKADGRSIGRIEFARGEGGPFGADDEAIAAQLARLSVLAIENLVYSEAQEANRLKEEFLATLSHELRTPLQAVLSWSRILRMDRIDRASFHRGLEVIERSAKAQTQMIDALLDVSRITSGKVSLEQRAVPLRDLLRSGIDAARADALAKGVAIHSPEGEDEAVVRGDPNRLEQVIANLLSNAIKFTPEGGVVTVGLDRREDSAEIRISDTGEGICREFLPHVFERFRQGDSSSTRRHGGLGIGLSVVRQLVELHGGRVRAESAGEGLGSSFFVQLPRVAACRGGEEVSSGEGAREDLSLLKGLRVLVVDDQRDARECLGLMLQQHGADVLTAATASEALSFFDESHVDVVLSDVAMPGEDGLSLIRRIRERPPAKGGRVPAGAVTAYARAEEVSRAMEAGFDLHLAKPLGEEELVHGVLKLVDAARGGGGTEIQGEGGEEALERG
jgi:signal transduction histidine kinase/DNA-binding response OmpR family regulator